MRNVRSAGSALTAMEILPVDPASGYILQALEARVSGFGVRVSSWVRAGKTQLCIVTRDVVHHLLARAKVQGRRPKSGGRGLHVAVGADHLPRAARDRAHGRAATADATFGR